MAQPRLSISLLGAFAAVLDQQTITAFRSDKARALLVFLAIEAGRPHAREALASLLWPNCPDAVALTYLRSALANLRQLVGDQGADPAIVSPPFFLITRQTVQLNPAADIWLDTVALDGLLAGRPTREALEQAVALCRGPFLESFSISDSDAFDEWLLFQREHVNRAALSALHGLTTVHIEQGRYAQAAACTRRQLALDPWDEGAHRQLMVSLALDGQRSAALAHYEACRRLLAEELGVAPARTTTELHHRIRTGALESALARPRAVASIIPPFVARDRELAYLDAHLAQALAGNGRVVFVTGQAGSGKTTLINEFARRAMATERNIVVAGGKCNAASGMGDPHLPFREIVQVLTGDIEVWRAGGAITPEHAQRLWDVVPTAAQTLVEAAANLLDRFVAGEALMLRLDAIMPVLGRNAEPPWRARLADCVKRQTNAGAAAALDQTNISEQVTAFLRTLARHQPLVVLLDDLQWADAGSISLLFHLGRRLAGSRILLVAAYRAEDVALGRDGGRHPLAPVVHELQRDGGDISLDLNQAEGQTFITALLDAMPNRLGRAFRDTLYHHTEGHPLFTVELLHGLQERGNLMCDASGHWVEGATLDWETLPARVEAVIAERMSRLPAEWQAVLRAASVEGEEFTAEVLARVQHLDERALMRGLSGLLSHDHHIVRAYSLQRVGGRSLSRYRFRHNLFRQYLYNELDKLERSHVHAATGAAMEAAYAVSEENVAHLAPQLAWHFEQAGNIDKAVQYWRRAGDQAMRLYACEDAIANYMRGVALLAPLPTSPEHTEMEMALQRAVAIPLLMTRGWGRTETMAALTRAYALARTIGAKTYLASALSDLSFAYMGQGNLTEALKLGQELLGLAGQDGDIAILVAAHRVIGEAQFFRGEHQLAREHMEQALALAEEQPGSTPQLSIGIELDVSCPSFLAVLLAAQGYPEQAAQWSRRALARAQELGRQSTLAFALLVAGVVFHGILKQAAATESYAKALIPLATEKGWALLQVWGVVGQGLGQTGQETAKPGIAQVQQGLASWQAMNTMVGRVHHLTVLANAYGQAGQIEQGLAAVDDALAVVEKTGLRFYEAEVWRLKGALLVRAEGAAGADAEVCFKRAIAIARRQTARLLELRAAVSLARLWQGQSRTEEARALIAPLYGWFSEGLDTPDLMDAHTLLQELSPSHSRPHSTH